MAISHIKLDLKVNIKPLKTVLARNSDLFGKIPYRKTAPNSPHREMEDIWVRFNDVTGFERSGDFSKIVDEHESIWYEMDILPEVKTICNDIMNYCDGSRLGGVLITRLPSGKNIYPHNDKGWHAEYYQKYYIPIVNTVGSSFYFEDGDIKDPTEGDVWFFDNSFTHWVKNESDTDRIALIVCLKTDFKLGVTTCHTQ